MAFHPCMRARWQRWRRHGNAPTLISSSRCTRWCIDCRADQLETCFCRCSAELRDSEQNFITLSHRSQRPDSFHLAATVAVSFFLFLSGKCLRFDYLRHWDVARVGLGKKRSLHLLFTLWWQPMWLCCGVLWVRRARPALLCCTYCHSRAVSCSSLGCR